MAYQKISTWQVAQARRNQGLGDASYTYLPATIPGPSITQPTLDTATIGPAALPATLDPFSSNPVIAGDIASGLYPPGASDTSPSGVLSSLSTLASAVGRAAGQGLSPLQAQTAAAVANPPSAIPPWIEYVGIGIGVVFLLALIAGHKR